MPTAGAAWRQAAIAGDFEKSALVCLGSNLAFLKGKTCPASVYVDEMGQTYM
jgi:hypothetical protein